MKRRDFIQKTACSAGLLALGAQGKASARESRVGEHSRKTGASNLVRLPELKKPVAIAMWDFSWILRHHRFGSFENWDTVLDGLVERGYNAIRMDAMPQLVAADSDGTIEQEFFCAKDDWKPSLWGNDVSVYTRPRDALLEFLPKCFERDIHVGLASWFLPHGSQRKDIFAEEGGLLRSWTETLTFLDSNGLLDDILYVDILNEYPFWHGYQWLKTELDKRSDLKKFKEENPDAHIPDLDADESDKKMNPLQRAFYNDFATQTIKSLKSKWPDIPFYASLDSGMPLSDIDLSEFGGLDYHVWFTHHPDMGSTGYGDIHGLRNEKNFYQIHRDMMNFWDSRRDELIGWMQARIQLISAMAQRHKIPCGNTEGWGPIMWIDHPALGWEWVKTSGDVCADLAIENGYKFICTSNFTHPQFRGMWEDVAWHKKITGRIKKG